MAEIATLARPYANAAFDIAKAANALASWSRMLRLLAAAAATNEVQALIAEPALAGEVKAYKLIGLLADELDERGRRFVHVLAENKRLELLGQIAEQYEARKADAERVLDVEVTAAVELTDVQRRAYADALAARFEQEVEVAVVVDPKLIGGAVVRAGDTVIDGSVRGRLGRLVDAMQHG